jgi:hypothetical protein
VQSKKHREIRGLLFSRFDGIAIGRSMRFWLLGPPAIVPDVRAIEPSQRSRLTNAGGALQYVIRCVENENVFFGLKPTDVIIHGTIP